MDQAFKYGMMSIFVGLMLIRTTQMTNIVEASLWMQVSHVD